MKARSRARGGRGARLPAASSSREFIDYAFFLDGNQDEHIFDTVMMRFVHALEHTIREGSVYISGSNSVEFDITCVPEAISALAKAYPELAIYNSFAKWLSCCNSAHQKHLPKVGFYSDRARVATCWWDERLIRPGAHLSVSADEVDARLETMVKNRVAIDKAYADYLDAIAKRIDEELSLVGICIVHWQKDWLKQLTATLDERLGKLGEGSGGTWFLTEEIMKVTPTRVLVTFPDCEYGEIFPGEALAGKIDDDMIYRACGRHSYGKFISHEDFSSVR